MYTELDAIKRLIVRRSCYWKQNITPSDNGKFGYSHIKSELTDDLIRQSITTNTFTFGTATAENGTNLCVAPAIDIDAHTGKDILPTIQLLYTEAIKQGYFPILEGSSGDISDGCHIIFPCKPTLSCIAKSALEGLLVSCGLQIKSHEVFPKQNKVPLDKYGNFVKTIFQFHNKNGKRGTIINPITMKPFERQEAIDYIMSCPDNVFIEKQGIETSTLTEIVVPTQSSEPIIGDTSVDSFIMNHPKLKTCVGLAYIEAWDLHGKGSEGHSFRLAAAADLLVNKATEIHVHEYFKIQSDYNYDITQSNIKSVRTYLLENKNKPHNCITILEKCPSLVSSEMCNSCPSKPRENKKNNYTEYDSDSEDTPLYTDMRNSEKLSSVIIGKERYNTSTKSWLTYTGKVWAVDADGQIYRYARRVVKQLQKEALHIQDYEARKDAMGKTLACESLPKLKNMVELCQSEIGVGIGMNALDTNQMIFNVQNGTIDLTTGKLLPHNPLDYITKISPITFDPAQTAPTFMNFVLSIMDNNSEMVEYLQKLFGYCMSGNTMEKGFYVFHGITDTGKSTLVEMILYIMGQYGATAETSMILSNKFRTKSTNDLADLIGARFVCASETEEGAALDESRIKMITSGMDSIRCRQLYQANIEYKPTYKVLLLTNPRPYIRGSDDAIWNRLHCIPFNVQIPKEKQDKKLVEKMKEEGSGILNWMIEGCIKWQKDGLKDPEIMKEHTLEYREEMDIIKVFIDGNYVKENGMKNIIPNQEMYTKFKQEQLANGIDERSIINIRTFKTKVSNSGLKFITQHKTVYWVNIREKATSEQDFDEMKRGIMKEEWNRNAEMNLGGDGGVHGQLSINKKIPIGESCISTPLSPPFSSSSPLDSNPIAFFMSKEFSLMSPPESPSAKQYRCNQGATKLAIQFKLSPAQAQVIMQDYCIARGW